jgi:hypothetical protein
MKRFKVGDTVKKTKGGVGTIRAIFTTIDGEQCYAVENEGALDFVEETKLATVSQGDLAAA